MAALVTTDEVRKMALSLPLSEEREHWGKPSFRVRNKIFAVIQPDGVSLVVKTTHEERETFVSSAPEVFSVPPHFAKSSYMLVRLDRIGADELRQLLTEAWSRVYPS